MTRPGTGFPQWAMVDEGWGRQAVDFATLSEPGNCREYVAVHHQLGVDSGGRLLDVACGSGLAVELARLRGASCSGIDASDLLLSDVLVEQSFPLSVSRECGKRLQALFVEPPSRRMRGDGILEQIIEAVCVRPLTSTVHILQPPCALNSGW